MRCQAHPLNIAPGSGHAPQPVSGLLSPACTGLPKFLSRKCLLHSAAPLCDPKILYLSEAQFPLKCGIWTREFLGSLLVLAQPSLRHAILSPSPVVPTRATLIPGDSWQRLKTFLLTQPGEGVLLASWVGARDAARHPTRHRPCPMTKNHLAPNAKRETQPPARCPACSSGLPEKTATRETIWCDPLGVGQRPGGGAMTQHAGSERDVMGSQGMTEESSGEGGARVVRRLIPGVWQWGWREELSAEGVCSAGGQGDKKPSSEARAGAGRRRRGRRGRGRGSCPTGGCQAQEAGSPQWHSPSSALESSAGDLRGNSLPKAEDCLSLGQLDSSPRQEEPLGRGKVTQGTRTQSTDQPKGTATLLQSRPGHCPSPNGSLPQGPS